MYAPDVVQGNDGRYYLYYCMSGDYGVGGYRCPISVAVCDTPAGQYEYLGHVKNPDGSLMMKYVCFDPAVMNDDGIIRLYYGTQYGFEEEPDFPENEKYIRNEMEMFGRTKEEILSYSDSIMGAVMAVLEDDMLSVIHPLHRPAFFTHIGDKFFPAAGLGYGFHKSNSAFCYKALFRII